MYTCLPVTGGNLSDTFLHLVESGLEYYRDEMCRAFAPRTFDFQVAIESPRLWVWWAADAVEAWPLFDARSEGMLVFLRWRYALPKFAPGVLVDTEAPRRVHQLDFCGTRASLDSDSTPTTTSILVTVTEWGQNGECLAPSSRPLFQSYRSLVLKDSYPTSHPPYLQLPTSLH